MTNAKVHAGFGVDKKVEEHWSRWTGEPSTQVKEVSSS